MINKTIDKKTILEACYIVNNKINYNKLDKLNKISFRYLENNFFKSFDKNIKLSFKGFNTFFYNIGCFLDKNLSYEEIYLKLKHVKFEFKE